MNRKTQRKGGHVLDADLSRFETLSLLLSLLAVLVSTIALIRSHRTAKRQLELQQQQANLARLQHKLMVREQESRARADLRAQFVPQGPNGFKFQLTNQGASSARNVRIAGADGGPVPRPFIASEFHDIVPVTELKPGEAVWLIAAMTLDIKLPVPLLITWDDDAGDTQQREIKVQITGG